VYDRSFGASPVRLDVDRRNPVKQGVAGLQRALAIAVVAAFYGLLLSSPCLPASNLHGWESCKDCEVYKNISDFFNFNESAGPQNSDKVCDATSVAEGS
jgi:hypothetical protein